MSHILQSQLEIDGYDSTTAAEIVSAVESKTDDVAYEYLLDLVDSKALINRYLAARKRELPESLKPSAKKAMDKAKAPNWSSTSSRASASPAPGSPAPGSTAPSSSHSASSSARNSPQPQIPQNRPPAKIVPYARAFLKNTPPQAVPKSKPQSNQANRQYKIDSINDLDAAIKKLDLENSNKKPCDCLGSVHGLLEMAPNCLWCGKIVCNKEGLGNCLGCGTPLIPKDELDNISLVLHQQRAAIVSSMGKQALKAAGIDPQQEQQKYSQAQQNLDKLLGFQASETQRTKIIDNAEDFETTDFGTNQWATPLEQARQLRNQQRQERKQNELRKIRTGRGRKVVSINIKGDKVYEEVTDVIESDSSSSEDEGEENADAKDPNEEEVRFWDTSKYGTDFVKPVYSETRAVSIPQKAPKDFEVNRGEDEVWAI